VKVVERAFQNIKTLEELIRWVGASVEDIVRAINGRISFVENVDAQNITVSFGSANADVSFGHSLDRVPSGWVVISQTAAMSVYLGSKSATRADFTLRSSAVGSVTILLF